MLGKYWENGKARQASCYRAFVANFLQYTNCILVILQINKKVLETPKYTSFQRYF